MPRPLSATFALVALLLGGCSDDPVEPAVPTTIDLEFDGLESLQSGFHYEGWAIIDGSPLATGKFNVSQAGAIVDLNGTPITGGSFDVGIDISGTSAVVITIEPAGDTDAVPADTHVLAGSISGGSASLTVGASQALGSDFSSAAGGYILATPTNEAVDDELSGIWFLDPGSVGLAHPAHPPGRMALRGMGRHLRYSGYHILPAGWRYEGWAVISGTPVTTGRFTSVVGVDEAAPFSGPNAGPPFPGEDFLMNAPAGLAFPTSLAGGTAVISIEPEPDDSSGPFTLKPLVGAIPGAAVDHVLYDLGLNLASFPTGAAVTR